MLPAFLISFQVSLDPFILLSDTRAGTVPMPWAKWQCPHCTELALGLLCVLCGDYVTLKHFLYVFSFNLRCLRIGKGLCSEAELQHMKGTCYCLNHTQTSIFRRCWLTQTETVPECASNYAAAQCLRSTQKPVSLRNRNTTLVPLFCLFYPILWKVLCVLLLLSTFRCSFEGGPEKQTSSPLSEMLLPGECTDKI